MVFVVVPTYLEYYSTKCYNHFMKVGFLGAGLYGEALGHLAEINEHEVKYYDPYRFPERKIEEVISGAEVVVYVAPAEAHKEILPELAPETPLILASKGFVSLRPFERFEQFSALGGAAFAEDIMQGEERKLTASSEISEQLFTTDFLTVEHTDDTKGIMLCGALKNVYAIGAGLMMTQENYKDFFYYVHDEMRAILEANGCDPDIMKLSCGLLDLMISCSPSGRNFRFGEEIKLHPGSLVEPAGTVEGLTVIKSLEDYPEFVVPKEVDMEIFKKTLREVRRATK